MDLFGQKDGGHLYSNSAVPENCPTFVISSLPLFGHMYLGHNYLPQARFLIVFNFIVTANTLKLFV